MIPRHRAGRPGGATRVSPVRACLVVLCVLLAAGAAEAAGKKDRKEKPAHSADTYDELYERYLRSARSAAPAQPNQFFNGLMQDLRARHVNDIVTIRVIENIVGTGTADSNLSKRSDASAGLPGFFGLESKLPGFIDPTNLAGTASESAFEGSGSTARASTLLATMSARVAEVLPNGDLLIEGVHEVEINGDRQIIVLTGIARVADITPRNEIASGSLGQLRIRYFGRGLMKDSLSPGWLIRVLNKIF